MLALVLASMLATTPAIESAAESEGKRHQARMLASLRASPSPRDQALATRLYSDGMISSDPGDKAWRGAALRKAAADAPDDRLVQWLWAVASDDLSGCDAARPCPERRMALARLEPDNAAAWMPVGQDAWKQHDDAALDAVLKQMAKASYSDELFAETSVAFNEVNRRYPMPATMIAAWQARDKRESGQSHEIDAESAGMVSAIAISAAIALPGMSALQACDRAKNPKAAEARFQDCAQLGRTLLAHGRTMLSTSMGTMLLKRAGAINSDDIAVMRGLRWRSQQSVNLSVKFQSDLTGFRDYFADLESTRNELRAQELQLQRAGISPTPPDGWMPKDLADLKPGS